jgi:exodeoxyribonuclease V alpha subunit
VGLSLATSPAEAVRLALRSKVLVITGGPGAGKTTLVNAILRILAAKRLSEGQQARNTPNLFG